MRARRLPRLLAVLALAGTCLVAAAPPAWAHANLDKSDPPNGTQLERGPDRALLHFSESVEFDASSVQLYTCAGQRIGVSSPRHGSSNREVTAGLPKLNAGAYSILWRVTSADAHPVDGRIDFRVGAAGPSNLGECKAVKPRSSTVVGATFGVARAGVFVGLALLLGGASFFVIIGRGTSAAKGTRAIATWGLFVLLIATALAVMFQGPYAAGTGAGDAFKWSVISDTLDSRYGHIAELRFVFAIAAAILLLFLSADENKLSVPKWWIVAGTIVGLGLAATPGLSGHADTGEHTLFAVPLDAVHIAAMSVWLGGLVALILTALGAGFSGGLRQALTSFARLAFWCVVVLVVSGVFASWRQVGFTLKGYTSTTFGHLLLIKLAIFVGLIGLAVISRSVVRSRKAAPLDASDAEIAAVDENTVTKLRKSVGAEVLVAVGVLAVTALLVNAQPARTELAPKLFSTIIKVPDKMNIRVTVDPARTGTNLVHVFTQKPNGSSLNVRKITGVFTKDGQTVPANLRFEGPDHWLTNNALVTDAGKWKFTVHVTQGQFGDTAGVTEVTIR
jgi:copper transport protein